MGHWRHLVKRIRSCESELAKLDEQQLRKQSLALRYRAKSGESLDRLLPDAFALIVEAASRTLGMRHYDVQLLGGIAMHYQSIAEMQTGEGKTLTATLPMYLAALSGKSVHLATANDYLARRDAEWMTPIYQMLGITVGVIEAQMSQPQRRKSYQCDVTYGTAKEFGFDFLRDRLLIRSTDEGDQDLLATMLGQIRQETGDTPIQRDPYFAMVDEADNILIDEARTPLIISALPGEDHETTIQAYRWAASVADRFDEESHYEYDHKQRTVTLDAVGRRLVRDLPKPEVLAAVGLFDLYEYVERAVKVSRDFIRDRHYVLRDEEIVIVDEFTGRLADGRKWRAGIHQAVEAQEDVKVTVETNQAARITVQDYFLRYERLAGMTGTAAASAREFKKIYELRFVPIPTHRPTIRRPLSECVFGSHTEKWEAIVEEVRQLNQRGQPVLIGTRSIDKSEYLSAILEKAGIEHQVLNANNIAAEAEVIAHAGQRGKVTVATNMAGRGTDIKLGEGVAELDGLQVICTELHDSARIDRQLIGRCARQGDPGTYRQYLALDDDILLHGLGPDRAARYRRIGSQGTDSFRGLLRLFRRAQARVERQHFRQRQTLMYHEKERRKMQKQMGQDPYLDTPG